MRFEDAVARVGDATPIAYVAVGQGALATTLPTGLISTPISFSGSGDNQIIAAVAGQTIRVFGLFFTVAGATVLTFKDGSTNLTGAMTFNQGGAMVLDPLGWLPRFMISGAFIINSSVAVQVSGRVMYAQG